MITVIIIDRESLALETGNTTKCMSCVPTIDLQAISNKQQPMSIEQQAMTYRLSAITQFDYMPHHKPYCHMYPLKLGIDSSI